MFGIFWDSDKMNILLFWAGMALYLTGCLTINNPERDLPTVNIFVGIMVIILSLLFGGM